MDPIWLLRMARWARRPMPWRKVKWLLVVVAICFALYAIEHIWGWPAWLTVNGKARIR